jgi:hypothetical protein
MWLIALAVIVLGGTANSEADVAGGANVRVSFDGWLTPKALPRTELVPVSLHMEGSLRATDGGQLPQLRKVVFSINRHGRVSTHGLPACTRGKLLATTSAQALEACRGALVGDGRFNAFVAIPTQAPFPSHGRLLAFNARQNGRPVILAHVFGTEPIPTSQVLTLIYQPRGQGAFGTTMALEVPEFGDDWGHVTGFELNLHRRYTYKGKARSLISASCPAPSGLNKAYFRAAKGTYYLADGREITRVLTGTCRVRNP